MSEGWVSFVPHAEIVLHPYDGIWTWKFTGGLNTRIDFIPGSHPDTFVAQAVKEQMRRRRHRRGRRFHSIIINYAQGMAVRVNSAGNEIERIGSEWDEGKDY